jgi:hypothetical protein
MNTDPKGDENIERSGEAAKEWLRNHVPSINRKWKSVVIQYSEVETREYFREQSGQLREYICPPIYILTYYRSFFRFFGRSEKAVIEFSESDICSITFRRDVSMAIWDALYYLYILLRHGAIAPLKCYTTHPFTA